MSSTLAIDPVLRMATRGALALLFLWSAGHKLRDVNGFRDTLGNYALLPRRWLGPAAVLLIAVELSVGVGLVLAGNGAALGATGLLLLYAGAIGINLGRGRRDIDCGCVGVATRRPLGPELVARNVVLALGALLGGLPITARSLNWVDGVTAAASVATLLLLYAAVDGLFVHAPRIATLVGHPVHGRRQVEHA